MADEKPVLSQVVQISGVARIKKRPSLMPPPSPEERDAQHREEARAERVKRLVTEE